MARNLISYIQTERECDQICAQFSREHVLGLDSEWVSNPGRGELPTSILQLSTQDGRSAVIRLKKICSSSGGCPAKLKELLADNTVLKVGVGIDKDVQKLKDGYNLQVVAWLDLRYLAREFKVPERSLGDLASATVGKQLNKSYSVQQGNWDADVLTAEQKHYAAEDAFAAALIFKHFKDRTSLGYTQLRDKFGGKSFNE